MEVINPNHLRHEHDDHPLNVNEFLYRHEGAAILQTTKGTVSVQAGSGKTPALRRLRVDKADAILAKVTGGVMAEGPCKCEGMRSRCKRRIETTPIVADTSLVPVAFYAAAAQAAQPSA